MKRSRILAMVFILIAALAACKKSETKTNHIVDHASSYLPLKPGNYWIYRHVWKDTAGNEDPNGAVTYDTSYVEKDTVSGINTYAKLWQENAVGQKSFVLRRDSVNCIIDESGTIYFNPHGQNSLLQEYFRILNTNDTLARVDLQMGMLNVPVTVPAGTFMSGDVIQTWHFAPYSPAPGDPRIYHSYYVDSIGIVKAGLIGYVGSSEYAEQQLVSYHVQQ